MLSDGGGRKWMSLSTDGWLLQTVTFFIRDTMKPGREAGYIWLCMGATSTCYCRHAYTRAISSSPDLQRMRSMLVSDSCWRGFCDTARYFRIHRLCHCGENETNGSCSMAPKIDVPQSSEEKLETSNATGIIGQLIYLVIYPVWPPTRLEERSCTRWFSEWMWARDRGFQGGTTTVYAIDVRRLIDFLVMFTTPSVVTQYFPSILLP